MLKRLKKRDTQRHRRLLRIRKKLRLSGHPRLCVSKTNRHIYAQIIDDTTSQTIVGLGTFGKELVEFEVKSKGAAKEIGKRIAIKAKEKNIIRVVFDRGRFKYHGLIAELAEGAREGGLQL